ncbi:MAG TPA: hypothetical protein VHU24_01095 [Solirubrobacterales bacterium]|jgi:hypothetical protein|nr:hypothetical protein [Solirubrobacterales bacterium]
MSTRGHWAIAFLIGLATVTAAGFGWRAAQIGSTAAYDDRQSISETVSVEQARIQRAVTVASQAQEYVRYRADYAVAAALDREADRLTAAGAKQLAAVSRGEAAALREGATRRAAAAGVFGEFTIQSDLLHPTATPRPFDYRKQAHALAVAQSTGLESPASLNPNGWAAAASQIRVRVDDLTRWAFLAVVAVLLYTLAEVTTRARLAWIALVSGILVYLAALSGALSTVFFT